MAISEKRKTRVPVRTHSRTLRTGKIVKIFRYFRSIDRFPRPKYVTEITIDGKKRLAEVWFSRGKRHYRILDDRRFARVIPYEQARRRFELLSKKRQEIDKRKRAKIVFPRNEVLSKYLAKEGTQRYDVEGLDTPKEKEQEIEEEYTPEEKEKMKRGTEKRIVDNKPFFRSFFVDSDTNALEIQKIKEKNSQLQSKLDHLENFILTPHLKETEPDFYEKKLLEVNALKSDIEVSNREIEKLEKIEWQEEPENFYGQELDPRYTKLLKEKQLGYANIKGYLVNLKEDYERKKTTEQRYRIAQKILDNESKLTNLENEIKELREHPKGIYYSDEMLEEMIHWKKLLPGDIAGTMPEKYQKKYDQMLKEEKNYRLINERETEEKIKKQKAELERKEKTIKEGTEKLKELRKKVIETSGQKNQFGYGIGLKGIWEDVETIDAGAPVLMDASKISLITTNDLFNEMPMSGILKDKRIKEFEVKDLKLGFTYNGTLMYTIDGITLYAIDFVEHGLKTLNNPKIYYMKDHPLFFQDKENTFVVAPRVEDDSDIKLYEDDLKRIQEKLITVDEYKKVRKMKREDLLKELPPDYVEGNKRLKDKDVLVREYLNRKEIIKEHQDLKEEWKKMKDEAKKEEILRKEFENLPEKGRLDLGSKGIEILNKINRLEAKNENIEEYQKL